MTECHSQENGWDQQWHVKQIKSVSECQILFIFSHWWVLDFTEVHRLLFVELFREQRGLKGGKKDTKREGRRSWACVSYTIYTCTNIDIQWKRLVRFYLKIIRTKRRKGRRMRGRRRRRQDGMHAARWQAQLASAFLPGQGAGWWERGHSWCVHHFITCFLLEISRQSRQENPIWPTTCERRCTPSGYL